MLKNSPERYGAVAKSLHWAIAALIIGLIWLGWYMVDLSYYDKWYHDSLALHKALGMIVLVLALMLIAWNLYSRPPDDVATIKPWEHLAAKVAHLSLYTMMVVIPITGYLISTSAGEAISIFGWVHIPALIEVSEALRDFAIELHFYLAYGTGALALIHMLAAFKHQFFDRDGTLGRML